MFVKDSVFRSLRLEIPLNSELIAFNNAFAYMKFLGDAVVLLPEETIKEVSIKTFGREVSIMDLEYSMAQLYHVVRSGLLSSDRINCTDKERKFFQTYNEFCVMSFELYHRNMSRTITVDMLIAFKEIADRILPMIVGDNCILGELIQIHDEPGKQMLAGYQQYFNSHIHRAEEMVKLYHEAVAKEKAKAAPANDLGIDPVLEPEETLQEESKVVNFKDVIAKKEQAETEDGERTDPTVQ